MKKLFVSTALLLAFVCTATAQNPFLQRRYGTPYEIPPFEKLTMDNYREGMIKGMEEQKAEIQAIIDNKEEPNFENVIAALDQCGETLSKTRSVYSSLSSSNSNDEFRALAREISPLTSAHSDFINMNPDLFGKVKYVYDNQSKWNLNKEQKKLLETTYKRFVNSGALLSEEDKNKMKEINQELSKLSLQFSQNLMHDTNNTYVRLLPWPPKSGSQGNMPSTCSVSVVTQCFSIAPTVSCAGRFTTCTTTVATTMTSMTIRKSPRESWNSVWNVPN